MRRIQCAALALIASWAMAGTAAAYEPQIDADRFGIVPDARTTFFVRSPAVGADLPEWGVGGALLYTPSLIRYRQYPQIGEREQGIVEHRVELDPYVWWTPIRDDDQALLVSAMLPLVVWSGAQSRSFAAGDLTEVEADEGPTLGDLQLAIAYDMRWADGVLGGVGLDVRLPTGIVRPTSFATDRYVRLYPRFRMGFVPADWMRITAELGNQLTLPGSNTGPLTGPMTTEGGDIVSETVAQLALSFLLPDDWFVSVESGFWFNSPEIADPGTDFAKQVLVLASFGTTFEVGDGDLRFHAGVRDNPMVGRREMGPTRAGALVRLDWAPGEPPPPPCEAPTVEVSATPPALGGAGGCLSFTQAWDEAKGSVVWAGQPVTIRGRHLAPIDGGQGTLVLSRAGQADRDLRAGAKVVDDGGGGRRVEITLAEWGPAEVRATTCAPAAAPVLACPSLALEAAPPFLAVGADERFTGRFELPPGARLRVTDEAQGYTFDVESDATGFRFGEAVTFPVGRYELHLAAVAGEGHPELAWLDGCPGVRVSMQVDEGACCDALMRDPELASLVDASGTESPAPVVRKSGVCEVTTTLHFGVGQHDTVVTNPAAPGDPPTQRKCAFGDQRTCEVLDSRTCDRCDDAAATLRDMGALIRKARSIKARIASGRALAPTDGARLQLTVQGASSELVSQDKDGIPPDDCDGRADDLGDEATSALAKCRGRRLLDTLCAGEGADIRRLLVQPFTVVRPIGGPTCDRDVELDFEPAAVIPNAPCPRGSVEHLRGDARKWDVIKACVEVQRATATFRIHLPTQRSAR